MRKMKTKKLALIIFVVGIALMIGTSAVVTIIPIVDGSSEDKSPISIPPSDSPPIDFQITNTPSANDPPNAIPSDGIVPIEDQPISTVASNVQPTNIPGSSSPETQVDNPVEELLSIEPIEVATSETTNGASWPILPAGLVTLQVADDTDSYFISALSGVPASYDIHNGIYPGWCVDKRYNIDRAPINHLVTLYSSLNPPVLLESQRWDMVNYILNNKQGSMMDVQDAIWYFVKMDGVGWWSGATPSVMAQAIVGDALANGASYIPGPGDIVAVICVPETDTQITIIELEIPELEGLSPGFWKHNIRVALGYPGGYSVPHDGEPRINYDTINGYASTIGLTLALEALTARGQGSSSTRLDMANAFNDVAGYEPYSD